MWIAVTQHNGHFYSGNCHTLSYISGWSKKVNLSIIKSSAMRSLFICILYCIYVVVQCGVDYYELLGVEKDADDRTIRKAFKKLAILKHPDKNTGDPKAHEEFVKINKAYEVLKDEEMRKKYDQFGEKGLEDGFQGGNNYQSWQFYNENFGIYDDDQEIVTLNRAEFTRQVSESNDIWFINFYSTYCSHCHQLAPTWRKFAREVEGAIRIGAVNCAEDPMLCQSQRVGAYPSLVMYPSGEFYNGQREMEYLVDFVMQRLKSEVLHLTADNFDALSNDWEPYNTRPWVIDFCDEMETCLSNINRRKLAAMLDGLVNVATIDCTQKEQKTICEELKRTEGSAFYPTKNINHKSEKELGTLDPKEISEKVISFIDGLEEIEEKELTQLFGVNGAEWPTAVWFISKSDDIDKRQDLRRLPAMFDDIRILYADCSKFNSICKQHLDITKLPQFVVFKTTGGYEIDYVNKGTYRDAASFIRESSASPLHSLDPESYNNAIHSGELWMIDYFAPWCPPCMKLMAEYRRLHSSLGHAAAELIKVKIGTIDCQKYREICQTAGAQSYPTSILYGEDGNTHRMVGYHTLEGVVEFMDNALNPSVEVLTPEDFVEKVQERGDGVTWTVDFFAPWCGPCQQLAPELQKTARSLRAQDDNVFVGSIDCQAHADFCRQQMVGAYPTIRLYPAKTNTIRKAAHYDYPQNMWRNAESMERWIFAMLPSIVITMGNEYYTEVLDSDEPWMVDFFAPWCGHCVQFAPVYEQMAKILDGKVKFAKVDCDQWPGVCQGAQVRAYPSIRLYRGRQNGVRQHVAGLQMQSHDRDTLIRIITEQLGISLHQKDEL